MDGVFLVTGGEGEGKREDERFVRVAVIHLLTGEKDAGAAFLRRSRRALPVIPAITAEELDARRRPSRFGL